MKTFKRIYYPIMALLFILMFTLSFVNAIVGNKENKLGKEFLNNVKTHLNSIASISHNSVFLDKQERVAEYIASQLNSQAGLKLGGSYEEESDIIYNFAMLDGKPIGTYVLQRDTISEETLKYVDENRKEDDLAVWEVDKEITNIVVYIPGNITLQNYSQNNPVATGDVVMMMAHYDSRIEGAGASDNGTQVAAMLENIIYITKNNLTFDNDLLFVFTDAEEEGMYGAYMFKHQFIGFDDLYSRVKLGTNFDALGNKGSLIMFESSDNNYKLISEYKKINGNTFASSIASFVYGGMSNYTDFDIYDDVASLNFATLGGSDIYHTAHDTIDNVSDSTIIQHANMMNRVIATFGDFDLDTLGSNTNAVFFSYLDAFTVVYSNVISYVIGAIMLGLLVGIIILNKKRKVFSWAKTGSGAVVQLLSIIGSVIVLFGLYYLFSLLIAAMGIIPLRAIGKFTIESMGLLISFMLLALVTSSFLTIVFRKLFNVKSADIVRGNVLIWGLIGLVLAFAAPHLSYFFAITALLEFVVLLLVTLLSNKFKDKYNMPVGMLFPYLLPIIIAIPMVVSAMAIASMVLSTIFLPLIVILFMLMSGFATPYCVLLKPYLDSIFAKIPAPSRRIQKEITETVEDKAKKGKFIEQTSIIIVKEKTRVKYRHGLGATILAFIFSIMAIVFSAVGFSMGKNYSGFNSYRDAVYNSSMVLVWEKTDTNSETTFLNVSDFIAYKHIDLAIGGFSWNFDRNSYVKNIYNTKNVIQGNPAVSVSEREYSFSIYSPERSLVSLKLKDAANITDITITSSDGETFTYENTEKAVTIIINIPFKFGSFTMKVEGVDNINLEYTESIMDIGSSIANLAELEEWKDVLEYYSGKREITNYLNSGIVFRIIKNKF